MLITGTCQLWWTFGGCFFFLLSTRLSVSMIENFELYVICFWTLERLKEVLNTCNISFGTLSKIFISSSYGWILIVEFQKQLWITPLIITMKNNKKIFLANSLALICTTDIHLLREHSVIFKMRGKDSIV